jgi:transcriptional regulator of acetoin/glycerol metabolism
MSSGPELHLQSGEFTALIKSAAPSAIRTRAEADVTIFSMCSSGLIGWWMDARARPARLGVPRTTLLHKMRKVGIDQKRVAFCNA